MTREVDTSVGRRVNSGDLWVFTDRRDVVGMAIVTRENLIRVFMYVDKLPLILMYAVVFG